MHSAFSIARWFTAILGILWFCNPASCQTVQDSTDGLAQRTPFDAWNSVETNSIGADTPFFSSASAFAQLPAKERVADACTVPDWQESHRIPLMPYWENGLRFISQDEQFNLHVGGSIHLDSVWLGDSNGNLALPGSNATSTIDAGASLLRRARLKVDGQIYKSFDYAIEFDLANAANENKGEQAPTQENISFSPIPRNVWIQHREVPFFGQLRIGNQAKPVGMSRNTSHNFLPFMERDDNMDGFYGPFDGGFAPGISASNWTESQRIAWRYGLYRPLNNTFGIGVNGCTISGRISALPVFEDKGAQLLHIGVSASQGSLVNDQFRLRARTMLRNGPGYAIPVIVDTTTLPASSQFLLGPELAAVLGPWTFQSEWTGQFFSDAVAANGQDQGTVNFHGGYAQVLYFLTGEHQEYEKTTGVFGRTVPHNSVGHGGFGAWQLGVRCSYLNLIDKEIDGGKVVDMTVGVNWFLNPNTKIQWNYVLAQRDGQQGQGDGNFDGFGVRAAMDF